MKKGNFVLCAKTHDFKPIEVYIVGEETDLLQGLECLISGLVTVDIDRRDIKKAVENGLKGRETVEEEKERLKREKEKLKEEK